MAKTKTEQTDTMEPPQNGEPNQPAATREPSGNAPAKVFRAKGVRVSLFRNVTKDGSRDFWKASVQRIYKEGDEFKTTNSLGRDDIPVVRHLLQQAWAWMLETES